MKYSSQKNHKVSRTKVIRMTQEPKHKGELAIQDTLCIIELPARKTKSLRTNQENSSKGICQLYFKVQAHKRNKCKKRKKERTKRQETDR